MDLDVLGKIRNTHLSVNKASFPVFECVVNSIHAIEEFHEKFNKIAGEITIEIERDESIFSDDEKNTSPIKNITVIDNGIGFDKNNFNSFNKSETTYKLSKGAKGIGRFVWLKTFEKVRIVSNYKEDGTFKYRAFDFISSPKGIENHILKNTSEKRCNKTTVKLQRFKEPYLQYFLRNIEDIAIQILEHCLIYFVSGNCPKIKIIDDKRSITVNDLYQKDSVENIIREEFKIRGKNFNFCILELKNTTRKSKLHFCANNREVRHYRLTDKIPELAYRSPHTNDQEYSLRAYLTGVHLDELISQDRTTLRFPKEINGLFPEYSVTEKELVDKCVKIITEKYKAYLIPFKNEKIKKYSKFIRKKAPQYRSILKYKPKRLESLQPNLSSEKLELELFKIQQDLDLEVKTESKEIFQKIESPQDFTEYQNKYDEYIEKVTDIGSNKLSQYIIHRKVILNILDAQMKINRNSGKYALENSIHKIIFPLNKTSDDIGYENQNLWILDEKLSYHKYLSSDLQLKKISNLESSSLDRPDILIFDTPFAFVFEFTISHLCIYVCISKNYIFLFFINSLIASISILLNT